MRPRPLTLTEMREALQRRRNAYAILREFGKGKPGLALAIADCEFGIREMEQEIEDAVWRLQHGDK